MARIKKKSIPSGQMKDRAKSIWSRRRREAVESVALADQQIEKLLLRRFERLVSVRRFVFVWITFFVLLLFCTFWQLRTLSPYYQTLRPVPGGLYNEGIIGKFTNANPMYASGAADTAVSHLVFSGLFKYDSHNRLVGDLASSYELSKSQTRYTVHLRKNVTWQDGKPFTADDVVYTYTTIQDIEAQSPLFSSWQGVSVVKLDNFTVAFNLPNSLSAFPYSLTNGIVPQHLLAKIPVQQLRSAPFNTTKPVGTGPFAWRFIEVTGDQKTTSSRQQRISLTAFKHYWAGKPKLDGISLITYADDQHMLSAFYKKEVNAISGLDSLPPQIKQDKSLEIHHTPLTTAVMAFFNTSRPPLDQKSVRQALVYAVNVKQLENILPYHVKLVNEPLLHGQLGYNPASAQLPYNLSSAKQTLDQAGWKADSTGQRSKAGKKLEFSLTTSANAGQYAEVAEFLQKAWAAVGITVHINYPPSDDDLQATIANHDYDSLLYGINIGVDPDVFAFWDSSQASVTSQGHLNLSEYKSPAADQALEAGRTRVDPSIRAIKYQSFLQNWAADSPALALYQPDFLYVTRGPVYGYDRAAFNSSIDRFYGADQWEIRQQKQTNR